MTRFLKHDSFFLKKTNATFPIFIQLKYENMNPEGQMTDWHDGDKIFDFRPILFFFGQKMMTKTSFRSMERRDEKCKDTRKTNFNVYRIPELRFFRENLPNPPIKHFSINLMLWMNFTVYLTPLIKKWPFDHKHGKIKYFSIKK